MFYHVFNTDIKSAILSSVFDRCLKWLKTKMKVIAYQRRKKQTGRQTNAYI